MEMERYVDTGEEGFVECLDTIGGEEEDTTIVLDVTETKINKEKKGSENNLVDDNIESFLTYKTATIAFLSRSCIDRCSRKTSA